MKFMMKWSALAFGVLMLVSAANAQSPREQLRQMVEQLQGNPSDTALRERIIRLAQGITPAPAVPGEALRYEGRAQYAFKNAKTHADYLDAAKEYEQALRYAPWVAGYYSDLCTIYEKAEKYTEAKGNCELYLVAAPSGTEVSDVRKKIGGLEFAIDRQAKEVLVRKQEEDRVAQRRAWTSAIFERLRQDYVQGRVATYQLCSPLYRPSGQQGCDDREADGGNWHTVDAPTGTFQVVLQLNSDEISLKLPFAADRPFCGVVTTANVADVQWYSCKGGRKGAPASITFGSTRSRGRPGVWAIFECDANRHCWRHNVFME